MAGGPGPGSGSAASLGVIQPAAAPPRRSERKELRGWWLATWGESNEENKRFIQSTFPLPGHLSAARPHRALRRHCLLRCTQIHAGRHPLDSNTPSARAPHCDGVGPAHTERRSLCGRRSDPPAARPRGRRSRGRRAADPSRRRNRAAWLLPSQLALIRPAVLTGGQRVPHQSPPTVGFALHPSESVVGSCSRFNGAV